jgi:translation initiation factor 2B subunit (eIF-2B alpha/beta/delta family)
MTQAREPDDRNLDRTLRAFDRRISRLEDTQVTGRELNDAFNRVYDEIDDLEAQMNQRFDELKNEMNQRFDSQDAKIDIILRHITGQGNS